MSSSSANSSSSRISCGTSRPKRSRTKRQSSSSAPRARASTPLASEVAPASATSEARRKLSAESSSTKKSGGASSSCARRSAIASAYSDGRAPIAASQRHRLCSSSFPLAQRRARRDGEEEHEGERELAEQRRLARRARQRPGVVVASVLLGEQLAEPLAAVEVEARARLARAQAARRALVLLEVDEDGGARQPVKIRAERVRALRRARRRRRRSSGGRGGGRRPPVALRRERSVERGDVGVELAVCAGHDKGAERHAGAREHALVHVPAQRGPLRVRLERVRPERAVKLEAAHGGGEPLGLLGGHLGGEHLGLRVPLQHPHLARREAHERAALRDLVAAQHQVEPGGTIFMPRNFAPTE